MRPKPSASRWPQSISLTEGVGAYDPVMVGDPIVIEVNSNPMLATLEDHQRWYLIVEIRKANIEAALK